MACTAHSTKQEGMAPAEWGFTTWLFWGGYLVRRSQRDPVRAVFARAPLFGAGACYGECAIATLNAVQPVTISGMEAIWTTAITNRLLPINEDENKSRTRYYQEFVVDIGREVRHLSNGRPLFLLAPMYTPYSGCVCSTQPHFALSTFGFDDWPVAPGI